MAIGKTIALTRWTLVGKVMSLFLNMLFRLVIAFLASVQFSHSVMSDSLRPHESQHARSPCPSPTLGVHSDSRPSSRWCHPTFSSSVIPFSSCPQSFPSNELALCIRWPKYWSFSFNISPSKEYSGFISFRIYWFDRFAVQRTPKSLLVDPKCMLK